MKMHAALTAEAVTTAHATKATCKAMMAVASTVTNALMEVTTVTKRLTAPTLPAVLTVNALLDSKATDGTAPISTNVNKENVTNSPTVKTTKVPTSATVERDTMATDIPVATSMSAAIEVMNAPKTPTAPTPQEATTVNVKTATLVMDAQLHVPNKTTAKATHAAPTAAATPAPVKSLLSLVPVM